MHDGKPGARVLIIQASETPPGAPPERGPLPRWVLAPMAVAPEASQVVDVRNGHHLPAPETLAAAIVAGSPSMVTDHLPWAERTAEWLRAAHAAGIAILGICFGHQLLAYALGGTVGYNPKGLEMGTVEVRLNDSGRDDPLLGVLPTPVKMQVSHSQTVLRLPPNAVPLASSDGDDHQAFRAGERAWGIQFHPEFDSSVVRALIEQRRASLASKGLDPDAMLARCEETPLGPRLLRRFGKIVFA